jgi:acyl-CoA thioesterase-2
VQQALDDLISLLDLENLEVNLFRGRSPEGGSQRVYGGQVLGQALVAAGRTVEDREVHSFHSYFLRPGDPTTPILYQVERTRDGRSFTTRRVTAIQHGRAIFHQEASFQCPEGGFEHQHSMPEAPEPESLPTLQDQLRAGADDMPAEMRRWMLRDRPIDMRYVTPFDLIHPQKAAPRLLVWVRAAGRLSDDGHDARFLHACVAAYASDMSLLDTVALPHAVSYLDRDVVIASLDHAMWFHRAFRADEWLLYVSESPSSSNSRGFARGNVFDRSGRLVASVAQEGLMRKR